MDVENPFKAGQLYTPSQSFLRKTWIKRFCVLYTSSCHGIQRLEVFDSDTTFLKQSKPALKIVPLTDCIKVTPSPQKHQANVFEIRTKENSYQFSAESFQEMTEWLGALQIVSFAPLSAPSRLSSGLSVMQGDIEEVKQEENLLYSSIEEPETYIVKVLDTEASMRNNLHGEHKLVVTSTSILVGEDGPQIKYGKSVFTWPYRHIRRYGCSRDNFSFEAGRKCLSGDGLFAFSTPDANLIFQSVDAHVACLRSSQSDMDPPVSPFIEHEKNSVFSYNFLEQTKAEDVDSDFNLMGGKHHAQGNCDINIESQYGKPLHLISKPPRKSKQGIYSNIHHDDNENKHHTGLASSTANLKSKNCDKVEIFTSGTKHQLEDVAFHKNKTESLGEPIYAVLEENFCDFVKTPEDFDRQKQLDSFKGTNFKSSATQQIHCNTDWDSHNQDKFDNSRALFKKRQSSDHVYGKILQVKQSDVMDITHDVMCSALKKELRLDNDSHSYENVQTKKKTENVKDDSKLEHIVRNDAAYALVFKNNK